MIVCLTPNPALDITYRVDRLRPGAVNRVHRVAERPGGKGVNVAAVLRALGHRPRVVLPLGGPVGTTVRELLERDGHDPTVTSIAGRTRRTVTVVGDEGEPTGVYEPGPRLETGDWAHLADAALADLPESAIVVVSGSLPGGVGPADLGALVNRARGSFLRPVVDTSGPALVEAARAGASLLKPNAAELTEATGLDDWRDGAHRLLTLGAASVAVSLGPDGLAYCTAHSAVRAWSPVAVSGNPTGAGDAVVASLAVSLLNGRAVDELVRLAAATGADAVAHDVAGAVDPDAIRARLPQIETEAVW